MALIGIGMWHCTVDQDPDSKSGMIHSESGIIFRIFNLRSLKLKKRHNLDIYVQVIQFAQY